MRRFPSGPRARRRAGTACGAALAFFLLASTAAAKGTPWDVSFEDDAQSTGRIQVQFDAKHTNGEIHEYTFNVDIQEVPTSNEWKADNLFQQVDDSPYFQATMQNDTKVRVEIQDDASAYEDIENVSVNENGTGEGVHIVQDDPLAVVYSLRVELDVTGTGTGGWFVLGVVAPPEARARVPQTAGRTGSQIESSLVAAFNARSLEIGSTLVAVLENDTLVIEGLPCPRGLAFGTSDTTLSYTCRFQRSAPMTTAVPEAGPRRHLLLHGNAPNPFNPTTVIRFDLASAGRTSLGIFDVRGRVVRTLLDAEWRLQGLQRIVWDGRDADGRPARSGVYVMRLTSGGESVARRVTLIR